MSGQEPPEHAVISRLTGQVFEKRLIEKHLETSDKCPITGEPMTKNDLVDIQGKMTDKDPATHLVSWQLIVSSGLGQQKQPVFRV